LSLQTTMKTYTVKEKAKVIYNTVVDVFDWNKTSDCVTPLDLVRKQFEGVSSQGKICIPGAGIGTYVLVALEKGFLPENITAVEIDPMYYELGSGMFSRLGVNYVHTDFLTWEPNMKFDVVIGNPPYQETSGSGRKDQASNLWTKFWIKSLELCGDDGYVSLITPTSWLSPSANLKGCYKYQGHSRLWDVFNSYTSVAQVTDVGTFFKGVGSSFGVVGVNKNGNKGLSFVEGYDTSLGFLPKSNTQEVINKLGGSTTLGSEFKVSQTPGSGWRVSVPLTRKVTENSIEILQGEELPSSGSLKPGLYLYVYVSSEAEATSVKGTLIPCVDLLNTYCRWSGFMNIKIFTMISHSK